MSTTATCQTGTVWELSTGHPIPVHALVEKFGPIEGLGLRVHGDHVDVYRVATTDATVAPLDPLALHKAKKGVQPGDTVVVRAVVKMAPGVLTPVFESNRFMSDAFELLDHHPAPEPEPEWKPGTVADIEVDGGHTYRAIRNDGDQWDAENAWTYGDSEVTDVRPLVVIDRAAVDVVAIAKAMHQVDYPGLDFALNLDQSAYVAKARAALAHLGIEATS